MTHNSSVNFKLIHFLFWTKGSHESPNFDTFQCSGENLPNSSCHFPNHKSVFLQTLHHSSVSWKITPLYFFKSNVIYFAQNEPTKVEILRILSAQVNIHLTWGIWWIFTQPLKSLKISLWRALCVQSIQDLSYKNTEELPFMTLNSDAKLE